MNPEPENAQENSAPNHLLQADALMAFVVFNYAESMARYPSASFWLIYVYVDVLKTTPPIVLIP